MNPKEAFYRRDAESAEKTRNGNCQHKIIGSLCDLRASAVKEVFL